MYFLSDSFALRSQFRGSRENRQDITSLAGCVSHAHCLGALRVKGFDKVKSQIDCGTAVSEKALAGMSAWVGV